MLLAVLMALVVGAVAFDFGGLGESFQRVSRDIDAPWYDATKDTDGDGLPDDVETEGWLTRDDGVVVTDPDEPDTDGDGLADGLEAGTRTSGTGGQNVYGTLSNPVKHDTDGDSLGDGDEFFSDIDPRKKDTDGDELADDRELKFGSDPTLGNPDEDNFSDLEEYDRGSDPLEYDLSKSQAFGAFAVGAAAGDFKVLARGAGRMNDAQLESPQYLAGQIASGVLGFGDIRDLAASIGSLDLLDAVVNAGGLVPGAGDTAKAVVIMARFAKQSPRAERVVAKAIERLPSSKAAKQRIRERIFGTQPRLPVSLSGGPKDNVVYKGDGYVGITRDFDRRAKQHAARNRSFTPEPVKGADGLSRGEARAIEEACIIQLGFAARGGSLQNIRHSISPSHPDYAAAVAWGESSLRKSGGTC